MDTGKPTKTLADYMVIAISPVLIMVLVHSVCFFLVDVFYRGEAVGGVRWVLFWFVMAVVLIARIGIEQGDGHAMGYGIALAVVTWIYLCRVQPNVVFGALLLGIVWFTAHKITSNCTLIDDEADASGQGLLHSLRKLPEILKLNKRALESQKPKAKSQRASQTPGAWLIYFSLAALPVFGLGQMLLPAGDLAARQRGFDYLFSYLAAALGLLVTTSFLGLRRYLRQRYLAMPGNIARGWIQFGVVGALVVLCLSLLLPRPGAGEAWMALRYHVDYQMRRASQYAARFNPHGQGAGREGNQSSPGNHPEAPPSPSGSIPSVDQNNRSGDKNRADQQPGSPPGQNARAGQSGGAEPEQPMPGPLFSLFKFLFYFAIIAGVLWLLYRYRMVIVTLARRAWAALREFIARLLGLFRSASAQPALAKRTEMAPFKAFKNPFLTGANRIWPPEKLIAYTYDALQSWALEQAAAASPQTPREFCRQLAEQMPEAANALEHLAFLYGHVAYGASVPGNLNQEHLRLLWDYMALPRKRVQQIPDQVLAEER
ncbi:MAG TPA: DUF4129 domain-containing protein [Candidatus Acidoferrales bacterium]|nr:DUF4129 domain-containing protein [Candidatus Acidoferrales bacterium]